MKKFAGIAVLLVLISIVIYEYVIPKQPDEFQSSSSEGDSGSAMVAGGSDLLLSPGDELPDMELKTLDGETILLSEFEGKPLLLNFWASWCGPCKEEMPDLEKFHNDYHQDMQVIAINAGETPDKAKAYIEEYGYTFTVIVDEKMELYSALGGQVFPTTYFVKGNGELAVEKRLGAMDYAYMEEKLKELQ
ncbi:cytochrome C biogenesis protein [Pontibacillus halophilus JSM 076056 = DSM 19796]|uniref:Cytochrome C biogenesis protein n=1 Tax=Pontibacillus halophilus JSM 076056 = DSM 19796 TaxID=1385510 RepID=A0A0A5I8A2_9BACI|nr:TlpA disulfide reductase family protein [Pontibacillus halophilus]KGX92052.1 cytochrome C biogenesis protein [Pontibacillus halophilus JSM 076056 = DSM 19796]